MTRVIRIAICAAVPILGAAACDSFLSGGELTNNPTAPTSANVGQLFVSTQSAMWAQQTQNLARLSAMWTQQLEGVARQAQGIYDYTGVTETTFDPEFEAPYIGGGIIDVRKVEADAQANSDRLFLGIAQIIEVFQMGTTADVWGDIPFTQAGKPDSFPTPKLDPQMEVYDSLQSLLSQAIDNINAGGVGPTSADLVYGGDPGTQAAHWTALAHTLKARVYLHTAEVKGSAAYSGALAESQQGISSNGGDYIIPFSGALQGESNPWWQFMDDNGGTGRSGDIIATNTTFLYTLLQGDPRQAEYYDLTNKSGGYLSKIRDDPAFPQPVVTFNENLLITAEAKYASGDEAGALAALNQERAAWGTATPWHSARTLAPVSASGPALLKAIMTEKYITLFQNLESWNDYKRTCIPALVPVNGAAVVPGRLYYGITERQTNPSVPDIGSQPARNANDPTACPRP